MTLFYKIINGDIAILTEGILVKADSQTRVKHDHKYHHISANVDSYRHSYFPRTIRDWDTVVADIVESGTVEKFNAKHKPDQIHPNSQ